MEIRECKETQEGTSLCNFPSEVEEEVKTQGELDEGAECKGRERDDGGHVTWPLKKARSQRCMHRVSLVLAKKNCFGLRMFMMSLGMCPL